MKIPGPTQGKSAGKRRRCRFQGTRYRVDASFTFVNKLKMHDAGRREGAGAKGRGEAAGAKGRGAGSGGEWRNDVRGRGGGEGDGRGGVDGVAGAAGCHFP